MLLFQNRLWALTPFFPLFCTITVNVHVPVDNNFSGFIFALAQNMSLLELLEDTY